MSKDLKVIFDHEILYNWANIIVFQMEKFSNSHEQYQIEMLVFIFLDIMVHLRKVG